MFQRNGSSLDVVSCVARDSFNCVIFSVNCDENRLVVSHGRRVPIEPMACRPTFGWPLIGRHVSKGLWNGVDKKERNFDVQRRLCVSRSIPRRSYLDSSSVRASFVFLSQNHMEHNQGTGYSRSKTNTAKPKRTERPFWEEHRNSRASRRRRPPPPPKKKETKTRGLHLDTHKTATESFV